MWQKCWLLILGCTAGSQSDGWAGDCQMLSVHLLMNRSTKAFNMLLLTTKWRSSSIMTILTFTVQELWFLKDWKMAFPVLFLHFLMNYSTKAFKILICCYWWQNGGQIWYWQFWFLPFRSYGSWKIEKWRFQSCPCIYS